MHLLNFYILVPENLALEGVANKESYLQMHGFTFKQQKTFCPEWPHLGIESQRSASEADTAIIYYGLINPHSSLSCDKYKKDLNCPFRPTEYLDIDWFGQTVY